MKAFTQSLSSETNLVSKAARLETADHCPSKWRFSQKH